MASFPTDEPVTDALDVPERPHFRARLDCAAEHYKAFRSTWKAYLERPHRLVAAVDDDGRGTLRMERVVPMPEDLTLTLGEFLSTNCGPRSTISSMPWQSSCWLVVPLRRERAGRYR